MAGIWNVNNVVDLNNRKISSKLSFQVGEAFLAKVMNLDEMTGEILLKLLDGWQFPAKLEKPLDFVPEGLLRFEVAGFEDGKLQLKLINTNKKDEKTEKRSIETLIKDSNLNVDKDEVALLEKMVKHNIPLTKENVSRVKTLMDMVSKLKYEENFSEGFIEKYVENKNIDINSSKCDMVKEKLRGFFREAKNLSEKDILTFIENDIDFNEENIKSFNKVFKSGESLLKDILQFKGKLEKSIDTLVLPKDIALEEGAKIQIEALKDAEEPIELSQKNSEGKINEKSSEVSQKNNSNVEESKLNIEEKGADKKGKLATLEKAVEAVKSEVKEMQGKEKEFKTIIKDMKLDESGNKVKEAINSKTEDIKNIIKAVMDNKSDNRTDNYNKVFQALEQKVNDIKVYNTISNEYYYLDLPVNVENHEYDCKLLIKDERKKGKKIDSTNVKIAASVNTENIGIVDAYLKVNNQNMNIDIKCEGNWVKILSLGKEKIEEELSKLGYHANVEVLEREMEMNLPNCREFFGDNNIGYLDKKV